MRKYPLYIFLLLVITVVSCSPSGSESEQGLDGQSGPVGQQGLQGEQGLDGQSGPVGQQGLQGLEGPSGQQGPQGENLADFSDLFGDQIDIRDVVVKITPFSNAHSGVIIGPNWVLSDHAFLTPRGWVNDAYFPKIGTVALSLVGTSRDFDLSLWRFDIDEPVTWVEVEESNSLNTEDKSSAARVGSPVAVLMYDRFVSDEVSVISFGHVSGSWSLSDSKSSVIGIDAWLSSVPTGGGVFSNNGKLLGIITDIKTDYQSNHFAVRFDEINLKLPELMAGLVDPPYALP
jgi:S1-C subfamily serine protease